MVVRGVRGAPLALTIGVVRCLDGPPVSHACHALLQALRRELTAVPLAGTF